MYWYYALDCCHKKNLLAAAREEGLGTRERPPTWHVFPATRLGGVANSSGKTPFAPAGGASNLPLGPAARDQPAVRNAASPISTASFHYISLQIMEQVKVLLASVISMATKHQSAAVWVRSETNSSFPE